MSNAATITTITIEVLWDDRDPRNLGWGWYLFVGGRLVGSGPVAGRQTRVRPSARRVRASVGPAARGARVRYPDVTCRGICG